MPSKTDAPSLADVTTHLRDVKYPADREGLLRCARADRAPAEILAIIGEMDDRLYGGVAEVAESLEGALTRLGKRPEGDRVERASEDSFPASDAPGYAPSSRVGHPPGHKKTERS